MSGQGLHSALPTVSRVPALRAQRQGGGRAAVPGCALSRRHVPPGPCVWSLVPGARPAGEAQPEKCGTWAKVFTVRSVFSGEECEFNNNVFKWRTYHVINNDVCYTL